MNSRLSAFVFEAFVFEASRAFLVLLLVAPACSFSRIEGGPDAPSGRAGAPGMTAPIAQGAPSSGAIAGAGSLPMSAPLPGAPTASLPTRAPTAPGAANNGFCAEAKAVVTAVKPTVWLVVDGSSSMTTTFDAGATRWAALRTTLMGPAGIVASLQTTVAFGLVIYSGGGGADCVKLITVNPALNNFAAIDAMYPMMPVDRGTPTDKALDHVFKDLAMLNRPAAEQLANPTYVILATDGAPNDSCGINGGGGGGNTSVEQRVISLTADASQRGANVYVISLAGSDTRLSSHLAMVAASTTSKHPPFVPATQMELITALGSVVKMGTCQVVLNGTVTMGRECGGTVLLNGQPLMCNSDNGWRLTGSSALQLTGSACASFLSMPSQVTASFPCEVFAPQ